MSPPASRTAWIANAISVVVWGAVGTWDGWSHPTATTLAYVAVTGWLASLMAVAIASRQVRQADPTGGYSGLAQLGSPLVFLFIPPLALVGVPWTLGVAYKINKGTVDGARRPGHGTPWFDQIPVGEAGKPLAAALAILAVAWGLVVLGALFAYGTVLPLLG